MFDRELLVADTDAVAPMLQVRIDPTLTCQPPLTEKPLRKRVLEWLTEAQGTLQMRWEEASELDTALHLIDQSTYVALQNLEIHAQSVKTAVSKLESIAVKDFLSMEELLSRFEWDLAVLKRITVHPKFQNTKFGEEHTSSSELASCTLAEYVDASEIRGVAQSCEKEMLALHETYSLTMKRELQLSLDLHDIVTEVKRTDLRPSEGLFAKIRASRTQAMALVESIRSCLAPSNQVSVSDSLSGELCTQLNRFCSELLMKEADMVQGVEELATDCNELQCRHLDLVQDIGSLQSDFAELSASVAQIDWALQSPPLRQFEHLQRLKRMCWAYGATLVEAVRRTEFTSRFLRQAQNVAELMAHVSELEITRRKKYVADIAPFLPWEPSAMELMPPVLDITTRRRDQSESSIRFAREDVDEFFNQLETIDTELPHPHGLLLAADMREALRPLLHTLDDCEAEFHRTARQQLGLSLSRDALSDDDSDSLRSESPETHKPLNESRIALLESQLHAAQERIRRLESELTARSDAWQDAPLDANAEHAWAEKGRALAARMRSFDGGGPTQPAALEASAQEALDPALLDQVCEKLDQLSMQCQRYAQARQCERDEKGALPKAQLSVTSFEVGSLALFLPTRRGNTSPIWAAFHIGAPHYFLRLDDALVRHLSHRDWLVARIVRLTRHVAAPGNEYGLATDTSYTLVDVDGWQDPASLVQAARSPTALTPAVSPISSPSPSMLSRWPWRQAFFSPMHILSDRSPRPADFGTATSVMTSTTALGEFTHPQSPS